MDSEKYNLISYRRWLKSLFCDWSLLHNVIYLSMKPDVVVPKMSPLGSSRFMGLQQSSLCVYVQVLKRTFLYLIWQIKAFCPTIYQTILIIFLQSCISLFVKFLWNILCIQKVRSRSSYFNYGSRSIIEKNNLNGVYALWNAFHVSKCVSVNNLKICRLLKNIFLCSRICRQIVFVFSSNRDVLFFKYTYFLDYSKFP